jgi:hypothetical protein
MLWITDLLSVGKIHFKLEFGTEDYRDEYRCMFMVFIHL